MQQTKQIRRGDIFYIDNNGHQTVGSEQGAGRPAIIVSNDKANRYSPVVLVVYLTTQPKEDLPTHVAITSTKRKSTALCEQVTPVSVSRIGDYSGTASSKEMKMIDVALMVALAVEATNKHDNSTSAEDISAKQYLSNLMSTCEAYSVNDKCQECPYHDLNCGFPKDIEEIDKEAIFC